MAKPSISTTPRESGKRLRFESVKFSPDDTVAAKGRGHCHARPLDICRLRKRRAKRHEFARADRGIVS